MFFATANYVVIGYFALKLVDGTFASPLAFYWIAASFLFVNVLAMILCVWARWFVAATDASAALLGRLRELTDSPAELVRLPSPSSEYSKVALLMILTIGSMAATWVMVVWYVYSFPAKRMIEIAL